MSIDSLKNIYIYIYIKKNHTILKINLKSFQMFLKRSSYSQILFKDSVKILHKVFSVLVFGVLPVSFHSSNIVKN